MTDGMLMRYSAFSSTSSGGNPAGVWIGNVLPSKEEMQAIACQVGFSETAFIAPASGSIRDVRYFSPEIEIDFCGHATIASGIALGEISGPGTYTFSTLVGKIPVLVSKDGLLMYAALTSVQPRTGEASRELVENILNALGWHFSDLDPSIPPRKAYAGVWHLVLAVKRFERLNTLEYDFDALKLIMEDNELTTLQLVWRESDSDFHSRNPFPVGGVVEDPATGAAAAALGGYLREKGFVQPPVRLLIHQGEAMGRPSEITVDIPKTGGIVVSGTATKL